MTSIGTFQNNIVQTLLADEKMSAKIDEAIADLKACGSTNENVVKLIFKAPNVSLRLTMHGNDILKEAFESWTTTVGQFLTFRQRLALVHNSRYPYYVERDEFTTYDRMLGMKLKLAEGSLDRIEEVLFR